LMWRRVMYALGLSTKYVVSALVGATLLIRRDAASLNMVLGGGLNAVVCKVLKIVINKSRPPGARYTDPGMPSSHACALGFLATYGACMMVAASLNPTALAAATVAMQLYSIVCLAYRVHTHLHTTAQVQVGYALGTVNGLLWHTLSTQRLNCLWGHSGGPLPWTVIAPAILVVGTVVSEKNLRKALRSLFPPNR
jgi:membrane-associated phospholipid phosphatase